MTPAEREWHARRRARLAWHEGAHALAAAVVGIPLQAASLRPGRGFSAVTLLGPAAGDLGREEEERRIVVTLAGRVGEALAEPLTGHPPPDEKRAARSAIRSLARRSPATADLVLASEANDDCEPDEASAYRRLAALNDHDTHVAAAHGLYLHRWALRAVEGHRWALRAVAGALYLRTVLTGAEIEAIVKTFRCACSGHLDWGPPSTFAPGTPAA